MKFYNGGAHECSYIDGQTAESIYFDIHAAPSAAEYELLLNNGFRRSGMHLYRPNCQMCTACVPTRVPVEQFSPNRSQRRNLKRNADLNLHVEAGRYTDEYFALWERYLHARHVGGSMADTTPGDYNSFLLSPWAETVFVELREGKKLVAVAVSDVVPNALSAVYTFFEPDMSARGLGIQTVLQQLQVAQTRQLDWLYLGYWISECQKMSYKANYQPIQGFVDNEWTFIEKSVPSG